VLGLIILLVIVEPATARFSRAQCWKDDCLQPNARKHLCYYPSDTPGFRERRPCSEFKLTSTLETHLDPKNNHNTTTTSYYDIRGKPSYLGDASFSILDWAESVGQDPAFATVVVCHTGLIKDSKFYTTCRRVVGDDDFGKLAAQKGACGQEHGHDERVLREKCCGSPRSTCPPSQAEPQEKKYVVAQWGLAAVAGIAGFIGSIRRQRAARAATAAAATDAATTPKESKKDKSKTKADKVSALSQYTSPLVLKLQQKRK